MRAEAASADVWGVTADPSVDERVHAVPARIHPVVEGWNPAKFAQAQIRSLVRQIFSPLLKRTVRQVVFTAVESHADIFGICMSVAATMAKEGSRDVALVGASTGDITGIGTTEPPLTNRNQYSPLRESAICVRQNLWLLPAKEESAVCSVSVYLSEVRREFEYSVIVAPPVADSNEATVMAQVADGIVLVLSEGRTRRATACRIRKSMDDAQVRLLGVVLSDREFPIPDRIYRRL